MALKELVHQLVESAPQAALAAIIDRHNGERLRKATDQVVAYGDTLGVPAATTQAILTSGVWAKRDADVAEYAAANKTAINPANLALILQFITQLIPVFSAACPTA